MDINLYKGKNIKVQNANTYPSQYSNKARLNTLSGIYYIYDESIINDRISICRANSNKSIGWISIYDIIDNESISIGDKVLVNGLSYQYADKSGDINNFTNEEMYIIDIIDSDEYENNIGIAYDIHSERVGFVSKNEILKYIRSE